MNPDTRSTLGKFFTSKKMAPDFFTGYISSIDDVKLDKNGKITKNSEKDLILATIDGEWSEFLNINNTSYWKYQTDYNLLPMERMEYTLPSDSSYRDDILLFKHGKEELAQEAKVNLEESQRHDRKLRAKKH